MNPHEAQRWLLAANGRETTLVYPPDADAPAVYEGGALTTPGMHRSASKQAPARALDRSAADEETLAQAMRERERALAEDPRLEEQLKRDLNKLAELRETVGFLYGGERALQVEYDADGTLGAAYADSHSPIHVSERRLRRVSLDRSQAVIYLTRGRDGAPVLVVEHLDGEREEIEHAARAIDDLERERAEKDAWVRGHRPEKRDKWRWTTEERFAHGADRTAKETIVYMGCTNSGKSWTHAAAHGPHLYLPKDPFDPDRVFDADKHITTELERLGIDRRKDRKSTWPVKRGVYDHRFKIVLREDVSKFEITGSKMTQLPMLLNLNRDHGRDLYFRFIGSRHPWLNTHRLSRRQGHSEKKASQMLREMASELYPNWLQARMTLTNVSADAKGIELFETCAHPVWPIEPVFVGVFDPHANIVRVRYAEDETPDWLRRAVRGVCARVEQVRDRPEVVYGTMQDSWR